MVRVPFRTPTLVGVNVTLTIQVPPLGAITPQLLVDEKSPDAATLDTVTALAVAFVTVTS